MSTIRFNAKSYSICTKAFYGIFLKLNWLLNTSRVFLILKIAEQKI
ncbi:Hypothetical protein I595_424 [Croceitalea dokdonensis DOKDO 023]|uniref:Uncharacterized protein n=1 Tax=Croceitalea dokdonensis DOKDO 023 TaxID=1300341 RepID=A0A0P7B498_9FLAO|nr:Hypothetical protein I595_424 [Croceitalea dokdonensis DOKDO 023]